MADWPMNNLLWTRPSAPLESKLIFLEDSMWMGWPFREPILEATKLSSTIASPRSWIPPGITLSGPKPSWGEIKSLKSNTPFSSKNPLPKWQDNMRVHLSDFAAHRKHDMLQLSFFSLFYSFTTISFHQPIFQFSRNKWCLWVTTGRAHSFHFTFIHSLAVWPETCMEIGAHNLFSLYHATEETTYHAIQSASYPHTPFQLPFVVFVSYKIAQEGEIHLFYPVSIFPRL